MTTPNLVFLTKAAAPHHPSRLFHFTLLSVALMAIHANAQTPTSLAPPPKPPLAQNASDDKAINDAKALIEKKSAAAAFDLLSPLEPSRAGELNFDYWLGVAAFETNRLERAAIAFERALVIDPDFDSARLELGRTYLRMGSLDLAEQEFRRLETRTTTPNGKQLLAGYLAEIGKLKAQQKFSKSAYVEFGLGYDTNVTSTTTDFTNAIRSSFGINGIAPTGNSIKRKDSFGTLNGGGEFIWRYRDDRTLFATVGAKLRSYRNFNDYQYGLVDAVVGHEVRYSTSALTYAGFVQLFRQDGAFADNIANTRIRNDRNSGGATIDWRTEVASNMVLAVGAQGNAFRYRSNPTQDTDQATLSATLTVSPQSPKPGEALYGSTFGIAVYAGKDRAKTPLTPSSSVDASRKNFGLRLFAQTDPRRDISMMAAIGLAERRDEGAFARATLVEFGRDRLLDVTVKMGWRFAKNWSLNPSITYIRNQSNIALYAFNKSEYGAVVRYEFN